MPTEDSRQRGRRWVRQRDPVADHAAPGVNDCPASGDGGVAGNPGAARTNAGCCSSEAQASAQAATGSEADGDDRHGRAATQAQASSGSNGNGCCDDDHDLHGNAGRNKCNH